MKTIQIKLIGIIVILLLIGCSQSETDEQVLLTNSLSNNLNIILIDAHITYDKDFIFPITRNNFNNNFAFCPQCPFWEYDSINNKAIIYSKFTNANIGKIKTLILIKYQGLFNKSDFSTGYLYNKDTLNVKSLGLGGVNTFSLLSDNSKLYIKTRFNFKNNTINAKYLQNFNPKEKKIIIENYKFKLIKNIDLKIKDGEYECE